jgi:hypothetical protein
MDDVVRKVYIDSPIFTREDEENFRYVSTDVEGETTRRAADDDEFQLQLLINDALGPAPAGASLEQGNSTGGTGKTVDRHYAMSYSPFDDNNEEEDRLSAVIRDSLEDDGMVLRNPLQNSNNSNNITDAVDSRHLNKVVNDDGDQAMMAYNKAEAREEQDHPSAKQRHVLPRHPADASALVPLSQQPSYDDADEYAEARLERARQRRFARNAHIPQLELIDSEDERADIGAMLDLEFNDGRPVPHNNNHGVVRPPPQKGTGNARHGHTVPKHRDLPDDDRYEDADLQDSLEVAQHYPRVGGEDGNRDYAQKLNRLDLNNVQDDNDWRVLDTSWQGGLPQDIPRNNNAGRDRPENDQQQHMQRDWHNMQQQSVLSSAQQPRSASQFSPSENPPGHNGDYQDNGNQRSAGSYHYLQNDPSMAVQANTKAEMLRNGMDFVVANKRNVRKSSKTYGQIYSRKKGKENSGEDSPLPPVNHHRPVGSTSMPVIPNDSKQRIVNGASGGGGGGVRGRGTHAEALNEQNSLLGVQEDSATDLRGPEQLWQARSKSLAARKDFSESNGGGGGSAPVKNRHKGGGAAMVPPLQKYPSDIPLEPTRAVVPHASLSAPYQRPIHQQRQQFSAGTFDVAVAPQQSGQQPPSMPQKLSVDINLNVMSPRPQLSQPSSSMMPYQMLEPSSYRPLPYQLSPPGGGQGHVYEPVSARLYQQFPAGTAIQTHVFHPSPGAPLPLANAPHHPHLSEYGPFPPPMQYPSYQPELYYITPPPPGADRMALQDAVLLQQQQPQLPIRYGYNFPHHMMTSSPQHGSYNHQYQSDPESYYTKAPLASNGSNHPVSPYRVLPPVGSSPKEKSGSDGGLQPLTTGGSGGSYMEQYRRQKKRPDYKTYTVDDYRKLKKEMKLNLGTLGPDLENETLKERKDKVQRQQEYAQLIRERNKLEIQQQQQHEQQQQQHRSLHGRIDDNDNKSNEEQLNNRRRLALEYAKRVPKPKAAPRHDQQAGSDEALGLDSMRAAAAPNDSDFAMDELRRLQERHQWEREQVARLVQHRTALPAP